MRPAINVWRDAIDATGAFVRFRHKPERAATAIIEADRKQLIDEILDHLRDDCPGCCEPWCHEAREHWRIAADEIERKFLSGEKA